MTEVLLDGERVNFEGPPPESALEVWTLLENFLGQSALVVDRFLIDGVAWDPEKGKEVDAYLKIEVFSISIAQNLYHSVSGVLDQSQILLGQWTVGSRASLSIPWAEFQSQAMDLLVDTQPIAQLVALLTEYSKRNELAWAEILIDAGAALNVGLSAAIDAFDSANCIGFSDAAEFDVLSGLKKVYQVLSEEVVKKLNTEGNE